jgi:hypothetical protein
LSFSFTFGDLVSVPGNFVSNPVLHFGAALKTERLDPGPVALIDHLLGQADPEAVDKIAGHAVVSAWGADDHEPATRIRAFNPQRSRQFAGRSPSLRELQHSLLHLRIVSFTHYGIRGASA